MRGMTYLLSNIESNIEYEIDIGTGAGGAEVVQTTGRVWQTNDASVATRQTVPGFLVTAGTRIAARIRASTTTVVTCAVAIYGHGPEAPEESFPPELYTIGLTWVEFVLEDSELL